MLRPYTDITNAILANPIKNGSAIVGVVKTGKRYIFNTYVNNSPKIDEIYNKYGNRFYNGIFVYNLSNNSLGGDLILEVDGGPSADLDRSEVDGGTSLDY